LVVARGGFEPPYPA